MTTDKLILDSSRLPATIRVGDHVELRIRAHVRRIEAEEVDVMGFDEKFATSVLHGQIEVELTIESISPA